LALDFEAIRRKVSQLSGNFKGNTTFWRPEEGEHTVRLLPWKDNDGQPFKEKHFHYGIGEGRAIVSLKSTGSDDPIQELIGKLKEEGTPQAAELCRQLYPKMRAFAPVVVRGQESEGVQLYSFGKMVYQDLLNVMLDADFGDITDPLEGRDIKLTVSKPPGQTWAKTSIIPRPKVTPLSDDSDKAKEWLDNCPDVDRIYKVMTYDEVEKRVNDWLSGGEASDSDGTEATKKETVPATKGAAPVEDSESYSTLDDAFADLLTD